MNNRSILFSFLMIGCLFTSSVAVAVCLEDIRYIFVTRVSAGGWLGAIACVLYEKRDDFILSAARGTCYGWVVGAIVAACKITSLKMGEWEQAEHKKMHVKTPRKKTAGAMSLNDQRLLQ